MLACAVPCHGMPRHAAPALYLTAPYRPITVPCYAVLCRAVLWSKVFSGMCHDYCEDASRPIRVHLGSSTSAQSLLAFLGIVISLVSVGLPIV